MPDQLPNPRDEPLFVRSQRELYCVVSVESRRTAFGYIVSKQFEEVVRKPRVLSRDLVHGEHQEIARTDIPRRNELGLRLGKLLGTDVGPSPFRAKCLANLLPLNGENGMLRRDAEPVSGTPRGDVDQVPLVVAGHELIDISFASLAV